MTTTERTGHELVIGVDGPYCRRCGADSATEFAAVCPNARLVPTRTEQPA